MKKPGIAGLFHGLRLGRLSVRHSESRFFHLGQLRVADHFAHALQVVHLIGEFLQAFL
jgi:hypothetical protein